MADNRFSDQFERAAGGMDYDDELRERAASLGQKIADNGPEVLLDEIENLLPEAWRQQVSAFPLTAVILGVGLGIWLGMKKGDIILAAGASMLTAAATQNVHQVLSRVGTADGHA
jgi:hypothetical protein